jgi:hypothetical protein
VSRESWNFTARSGRCVPKMPVQRLARMRRDRHNAAR